MSNEKTIELVATRPEADVAADLKARIEEAFKPVCAIMDEAVHHGLQVAFDGVALGPPYMRHRVMNVRIVKTF